MTSAKPFTLEHFRTYCGRLKLDSGDFWDLENFQVDIIEPILAGVPEVWAILPQGNGKTTLLAGVSLYFCDYTPNPWIPIGASSRDQAEVLAQQAYQMIRSSPGMAERFKIYEGYRLIKPIRPGHPGIGSRGIKVYAADVGTADGVIPTLAICDEGHRHPDMSLYRLWKGKLGKRGGQIVMISTAGEPGSEFEQLRDQIRVRAEVREQLAVAHTRYTSRSIVMNEWRIPKAGDFSKFEIVKAANPLSSITALSLKESFESPTTDVGDWKRLVCNVPARTHQAAVSESEWDDAFIPRNIPDGAHIDLGVDAAWKHDTFAIVPLWRGGRDEQAGGAVTRDYRLLGDPEILIPPRDGSTLHPDEVKIAFERFFSRFIVDTIVLDLHRAEDIASWLEEQGVTVIEWSQGNVQAAKDYEHFMDGLRNGTLRHNGNVQLRSHVMNGIARALPGDKRRFDRPSQSRARKKQDERVIDALVAAAMVNAYAVSNVEPPRALAGSVEDYRIIALG